MTIRATATQENAMNVELGTSAEVCEHCGSDVWADVELGLYFDARLVTEARGYVTAIDCPGTSNAHEVA